MCLNPMSLHGLLFLLLSLLHVIWFYPLSEACICQDPVSRDSAVGIATGYGLDD
jgi:hypothetical protein